MAGPHSIGKTVEVSSPIGEPPVFIRDCDVMNQFVATLKQNGVLSSKKKRMNFFPAWRGFGHMQETGYQFLRRHFRIPNFFHIISTRCKHI